jgi:hypothetical protein
MDEERLDTFVIADGLFATSSWPFLIEGFSPIKGERFAEGLNHASK